MSTDIVAEARSYIGVRWKHQGRSRNGVDCAGLVIVVAQACRWSTFDFTGYPKHATDETMLWLCAEQLIWVPKHRAAPGDVMVFRYEHQRHIGILGDYFAGGLSLIHAYLPSRSVVEVRLDDEWRGRAMGAYRFPETM